MAGQWQGGQWQPEENVQPNVQPNVQFPPFTGPPGQQYPPPPQSPYPPQYWQQYPPQAYYPPPVERKTVTVQSGSTVFHVIMTFFTGGLWIFVWLACRRKVRVTTRYR